jgi:hypothetical protein
VNDAYAGSTSTRAAHFDEGGETGNAPRSERGESGFEALLAGQLATLPVIVRSEIVERPCVYAARRESIPNSCGSNRVVRSCVAKENAGSIPGCRSVTQ